MAKPKRESVRQEMLTRLRRNRDGRLTPDQWIAMTTEPLVTVLLLLSPVILIIGFRLPLLATRGVLIALVVIVVLGFMLLMRARRYARANLNSGILYAAEQPLVRRLLGQAAVFYDDAGDVYKFSHWLAPRVPLIPNHPYRVYYLREADQTILCSLMSQDDPEFSQYQPTPTFQARTARRASVVG
jgi:hypothetical protein